ncbi:MAG: hypothetical protein GY777_08885 [Candidatus Brocadiaceae bacterium]|nr:hypothetical protein [Candidatus Brocadiaceae bacterium]
MNYTIKKWILLGPGNGKKTEIVMQCLLANPVIKNRPFVFVSDSETGCAIDCAKRNNIQVTIVEDPQFKSLKSTLVFDEIDADLLVSCGWNYIIPKKILDRFRFDSLNCHSSLLPDYKGQRAYLHQWANLEKEYGVSIHILDEKLDEGHWLLQGRLKLYLKENLEMMHRRMSETTGFLLPQALLLIEQGYKGEAYDKSLASRYFYKITPKKAKLHRFCNTVLNFFHKALWMTPHDIK